MLSLAYFYDRNYQFQESDTANKISQAKVMIHNGYMSISPEEVAARLCLSYSSFRKTFKEYTGFSPARFINEVRMSKAKELLTNTAMSIKEVAYNVGYNNHDYFFTAFRHMTGQTPLNIAMPPRSPSCDLSCRQACGWSLSLSKCANR